MGNFFETATPGGIAPPEFSPLADGGCRWGPAPFPHCGSQEVNAMPRSGSKPKGLSRPYLTGLAVALIFGVAVFFRLYELGSRNLWTDEAWVALAAMQPTAKEALAAGQSTPPFYLLTVWAMVQLWGHGEAVLRSLSWLFGVGTLWFSSGASAAGWWKFPPPSWP